MARRYIDECDTLPVLPLGVTPPWGGLPTVEVQVLMREDPPPGDFAKFGFVPQVAWTTPQGARIASQGARITPQGARIASH